MTKNKSFIIAISLISVSLGFSLVANAQSIGVTLPSVPGGVSVTSPTTGQVTISWGASTESSGTIAGYYVYRNGTQLGATAGTSITDGGLLPGLYSYTVAAYDPSGNVSAQSSPANITLAPQVAPSTPTGVTVTGATTTNSYYSTTVLTISWTAPSTGTITGYIVYRDGTNIASTSSAYTATSITDTVPPGTYTYDVSAYDSAGDTSNLSIPVRITVSIDTDAPSVPANVTAIETASGTVTVSWTPSTDTVGIAGYQIFRGAQQVGTSTSDSYIDSGLTNYTNYAYSVDAYDNVGNISLQSNAVSIVVQSYTGVTAPYSITSSLVGTSTVDVSWVRAGDILPITGYTLYENDTQIGSTTSTNYLEANVLPGTYAYTVTASDATGAISAMSATSTITVPVPSTSTPAIATIPTTILPVTITTPSVSTLAAIFTQTLYYGLRNAQVKTLQSLLVGQGYLSANEATGFFGSLTLAALKKFQCNEAVVCTGGAGWGNVGPKTRAELNAIEGGTSATGAGSTSASASASGSAGTQSTAAMTAELQALQTELASLEKQLP